MSVIALDQRSPAMQRVADWLRHSGQDGRRGQIAVAFIALIALILVLTPITMNLGEVARIKTATANAADAGALAGASWVASGENELAWISMGMWTAYLFVRVIYILPFCQWACIWGAVLWAALVVVNYLFLYHDAALPIMKSAWKNAKAAAVFTAIQNALIDDLSGDVNDQLKTLNEDFENTRVAPTSVRLEWVRKGADETERPSWVRVDVEFPDPQPELEMEDHIEPYLCWLIPCFCIAWFCCCLPLPGYVQGKALTWSAFKAGVKSAAASGAWLGAAWGGAVALIKALIPTPGICPMCWIPIPIFVFGSVTPDKITNGGGDVIVTVTQHRQGGGILPFWKMRYPDEIQSRATAHYEEASVDLWPDDDSQAQLTDVR